MTLIVLKNVASCFIDSSKAMIVECSNNSSALGGVDNEVFNELMYESVSDQGKKYYRLVGC